MVYLVKLVELLLLFELFDLLKNRNGVTVQNVSIVIILTYI